MRVYCFDLDNTLCYSYLDDYATAIPIPDRIAKVNDLYARGFRIIIHTARGSKTGIDWRTFTERQLESWGLSYHELSLSKPFAHAYIDDKACKDTDFDWSLDSTI